MAVNLILDYVRYHFRNLNREQIIEAIDNLITRLREMKEYYADEAEG